MIFTQLDRLPLPPSPMALTRRLPVLAARSSQLIPFNIQKTLMIQGLQRMFQEALEDGDWEFLQDRCVRVHIQDAKINWYFGFDHGDILIRQEGHADASISGNLKEFLLLASRKEDPDSLFFQRRLLIEGDTELGLEVKNVMDSFDLDSLPPILRSALNKVTDLVCRLAE